MNTGPKLAVYGLALVATLGVGAAAGAVVGPIHLGGDAPAMHMSSESRGITPATLPRRIGPAGDPEGR